MSPQEIDPLLVLRAAVRETVMNCSSCDGSGILQGGPGAGLRCPVCARARHALQFSAGAVLRALQAETESAG
jgi:hypothetical protein